MRASLAVPASVMVSVLLPSALRTVTSVVVRVKLPLPVGSLWVVTDRPEAEVMMTVWSNGVLLALTSLTVSVRLPSAPSTVTSLWVWVNTPAPVGSLWVVTDRPLALVVLIV